MALTYPTSLLAEAIPLRGFDLGERGNTAMSMLEEYGFAAFVGITPTTLKQIQAASRERGIAEFCSNDKNRYSDTNFLEWLKKNRISPHIQVPADSLGAYSCVGPEKNKRIPGADFTTAYRVTEAGSTAAREIRDNIEPSFRLGLLLGELVLAISVTQLGLQPSDISLETWKSNHKARRVYDDLGFVQKNELLEEEGRPTLHNLGEFVDGHPVFVDPADANARRVIDSRCYYVLENY